MKRGLVLALLVACGSAFGCGSPEPSHPAPPGAVTGVTVILKGGAEPLPFDPRGGRLTVVTREISEMLEHPLVLELDTALSPELKVSLEESVLASFETIAKELVYLLKEDPEMFALARRINRVACKYDAVAKESSGALAEGGERLEVVSPPDRFPLLERGILVDAVYTRYVVELDKRWGDLDPSQLGENQRDAYLSYMFATRPGAGYLWIAARARRGGDWEALREEHFRRVMKLGGLPRVRHFMATNAPYASSRPGLRAAYAAWLTEHAAGLDEPDRVALGEALFKQRSSVTLTGFDRFGWGLSIYDQWLAGNVRPGSDLEKIVVCPRPRRGEAEKDLHLGCSDFFATVFSSPTDRAAFRDVVLQRREADALKLQELALLNLGYHQEREAIVYLESVASRPALFTDGVRLLFHDHARLDEVRHALDEAAPKWWRDHPAHRGLWLLVMARRWSDLHVHYADSQSVRWVAEYGGPIKKDVLAAYLAEGPRAVEMAPKIWLAFARSPDRDAEVARSLKTLLDRDREGRTSRITPTLKLLRARLCAEKNATGLTTMRSAIESWANEHPDSRALVSNALFDFSLARCPKDPEPDPESGGR